MPSILPSSSTSSAQSATPAYKPTKTVLVVGASYAGYRATQKLVQRLPPGWRVVCLERNTHMNHLYAFPRVSVLPTHEQKVFIPYTNIFTSIDGVEPPAHAATAGHALIHGCLTKLDFKPAPARPGALPYGRGVATYRLLQEGAACCRSKEAQSAAARGEELTIRYDYLVYALGCNLPPPINVWSTASNAKDAEEEETTKGAEEPSLSAEVNNGSESISSPPAENIAPSLPSTTCCMSSLSLSSSPSSSAPTPCRGSKTEGVAWLRTMQSRIRSSRRIVVIGAGALGVQFATDIASLYGTASYTPPRGPVEGVAPKEVTLLCSRDRLLPRFGAWMHRKAHEALQELGIDVRFNARADLNPAALALEGKEGTEKIVRTTGEHGQEFRADLVLFCTGQEPTTAYLREALARAVAEEGGEEVAAVCPRTRLATVNRYLQLSLPPREEGDSENKGGMPESAGLSSSGDPFDPTTIGIAAAASRSQQPRTTPLIDNVFVVGDCCDAFGALNAGHTAWGQANTATENIVRLVQAGTQGQGEAPSQAVELEAYTPPPPGIKVSLGLDKGIRQYQGLFEEKKGAEDCKEDLNTGIMWTSRGFVEGGVTGDWSE
ncbi:FAD/NAD(P)-binding domain-containing protein [Jaminaea rosea]|uniref:FAD/NAD(P)-binding domain-containing protein n=1 Tax=Jaminaea rosea TaxID=1569628 RepID=A0A316UJ85_9BASI|nr:FAD/NAD(P)-binding domain-containing protein [Jaminaea rosea]PWN25326.1 FAD/NAD(P)-binding domain-containing protein [Jaminaea rosea]